MFSLKHLVAAIAAACFGIAFAQGTPPNTSTKDPATGAGQRSTENTPMGATGTPANGGAAAQGSPSGSSAASSAATPDTSSSTSGTTSGSATTTTTDTGTSAGTGSPTMGRSARSDRN